MTTSAIGANNDFDSRKQSAPPLISPIVSEALTKAQTDIRERLANMRKLFDDDDEREKEIQNKNLARLDSSEWDLHNHKLMYEEAMEKREKHLELIEARKQTKGVKGEHPKNMYPQD